MKETPYFKKKLLCTAPDGTYSSFGGSKTISGYSDRIEIGKEVVPYTRILEIKTLGNVLHLIFADPQGKRVERYFRYDKFLPGKAVKELQSFHAKAASYIPLRTSAGAAHMASVSGTAVLRCEQLGKKNQREQVLVHSASVSFPPFCPVCMGSPAEIARLDVASSFGVNGFWMVPVCRDHKSLKSSIKVHGWNAKSSQVTFSFSQPEYAQRFYQLNAEPELNPWRNTAESSEIFHAIRTGTRFVVYQYIVSVIRFTFLRTSGIHKVHSRGQAILKGLPWILFDMVFGWWSIAGLIWTPVAIYRNLKGGIDVTAAAEAATIGQPISASGV